MTEEWPRNDNGMGRELANDQGMTVEQPTDLNRRLFKISWNKPPYHIMFNSSVFPLVPRTFH